MSTDPRAELVTAGRVLADRGLVSAFGHVSCRLGGGTLLITPPRPLGSLCAGDPFVELRSEVDDRAPREAWLHLAVARSRPDVRAICRAQPCTATALAATGVPIVPLHGQGSLLGQRVPVFDEAELVRDPDRAERVADCLGGEPAVVLRGNGAVTVGATVGEAVALMWVLETSAIVNQLAGTRGDLRPLSEMEQRAWRAAGPELLARIWDWLSAVRPKRTSEGEGHDRTG